VLRPASTFSHDLDVFLFERETGRVLLVFHTRGPRRHGGRLEHRSSISADGRFVAFTSTASNVVSGQTDVNNVSDVFVYQRLADG
jgi:hypothetical protein